MAIETRSSSGSLSSTSTETPARPSAHWGLRGTIAALAAFMALTAIAGAIFVVPTMPRSVLHNGVLALFPDYTIPALALGVLCGGAALVALVAVFVRPQLGALAAVVAGLFMIAFELVEILVVGFTPAQTPDQFPAWLQVVYLAVGGALVLLGARLWKTETGSYALRWPPM
jgi:hypothetical protein